MNRLRRVPGLTAMAAIGMAGAVALWLGWRAVAGSIVAPIQMPGLVSGGLAGLALVGAACAFLAVQVGRRDAAQRADEIDAVLDEVAAMAAAMRRRRHRRGGAGS